MFKGFIKINIILVLCVSALAVTFGAQSSSKNSKSSASSVISSAPDVTCDVIFQSFEEIKVWKGGQSTWVWDKSDKFRLSEKDEPVYEGKHSLRHEIIKNPSWKGDGPFWRGFGMQSETSSWDVDLNPDGKNNELILWVYALPINSKDNNLNVQIYDNDKHGSDDAKAEYWTKDKAQCGKWTKIRVPFNELLKKYPDLDLHHINKIQIQQYWPGVYYYDYMIATR